MLARVSKVSAVVLLSFAFETKGESQTCATPAWFLSSKASSVVSDGTVTATCYAEGRSSAIAYDNANSECIALGTVSIKTDIQTKSHLIQSERQAAFLQEVKSNACFRGVVCAEKKRVQCVEQGVHKVWLQCSINVSGIETYTCNEPTVPISSRKSSAFSHQKPLHEAGAKEILISSVPLCEDIMVIGESGRVVKCESNPTSVSVHKSDTKLILRRKDFRPFTIEVNDVLMQDREATAMLQKAR